MIQIPPAKMLTRTFLNNKIPSIKNKQKKPTKTYSNDLQKKNKKDLNQKEHPK